MRSPKTNENLRWKLLIVHESQLLLETSKQHSHSHLSFVCKFTVIYT